MHPVIALLASTAFVGHATTAERDYEGSLIPHAHATCVQTAPRVATCHGSALGPWVDGKPSVAHWTDRIVWEGHRLVVKAGTLDL